MFLGIGVIVLVGFVMYRLGKSKGSSSAREEIRKQGLTRKAAGSDAQMPGQAAERPATVGKAAQLRDLHGHSGSYGSAIAAGVLGVAAGAALMHGHDEAGKQERLGQMNGLQQYGNDLSENSFMDDSYDVDDDIDPDEMQDDVNDDGQDYDGNDNSDDGGGFFDDGDDDGDF